ncbi:MAG: hypothetical protein ACM3QZ_14525 [Solirubrobacterales bacterium]
MEIELLGRMQEIALESRHSFTAFIDENSRANKDNMDWWVSSVSNRNTLDSPLFYHFCCLALVKELADNRRLPPIILTGSPALASVIKDYAKQQGIKVNVRTGQSIRDHISRMMAPIRSYLSVLSHVFRQAVTARLSKIDAQPASGESITLVETFVLNNSFSNGRFVDRYYPGMLDSLGPGEAGQIRYLPTFYEVRKYREVFRYIRQQADRFLVKEDYLCLPDYWNGLTYPYRTGSFRFPQQSYLGFKVGPLLKEELYRTAASYSSIEGLLKFNFAKRLRGAGVSLRLVVDWFENQIIDHGVIAGLKRSYPDVPVIGYSGYPLPQTYLCAFPTEVEMDAGILPDEIVVIGAGWVQMIRMFCPKLHVTVGPAFRFQGVGKEYGIERTDNRFTVLVGLPIREQDGLAILRLLKRTISQRPELADYRFCIKPHPSYNVRLFKQHLGRQWPDAFEIVEGSFDEWVSQADLLISNASSTCMETLVRGVPVIIAGNQGGLTPNPISSEIDQALWRICFSPESLGESIAFFESAGDERRPEWREYGKQVAARFFSPVSAESVHRLLRWPQGYLMAGNGSEE